MDAYLTAWALVAALSIIMLTLAALRALLRWRARAIHKAVAVVTTFDTNVIDLMQGYSSKLDRLTADISTLRQTMSAGTYTSADGRGAFLVGLGGLVIACVSIVVAGAIALLH
jgi:hypothetical protein